MQTARAENEIAISLTATQQLENKIKGCISLNNAAIKNGAKICIIGNIINIETDTRIDSSEPPAYFTYFSYMPNEFFIYGNKFLGGFIGKCVFVYGKISLLSNGTPYMIATDLSPDFSIDSLPDTACLSKP
jgi:hypothetical protein